MAEPATPATVSSEIRSAGARAVLAKYFDTPDWEKAIIPGIKGATDEWLSVARSLSKVADAAPSEELGLALYAALPVRPFAVLTVLRAK